MFKYISEILSHISIGQRLIALCVVLLSVIIISLGPSFISGMTQDNEELVNKVEVQRGEIELLTLRVNELNGIVIYNQRECTNRIVEREVEILEMIKKLEGMVGNTRNMVRSIQSMSIDDGDVVMMRSMPEVPVINDDALTDMIRYMRKDVERCIKENGG
jgi:hypothetical protein